ncbi:hypothetical protein POWCR01_080036300 [Plasmodium ovale]|uniref:Uncharacterized protein n=1 Tax=Plasmodium ovale TaxID=36330 RepID=A0A1C3KRV1_PLAOA|nr:hypothetical protein POWCR01_080036300 [Plasmodium ovale]
MKAGNDIKKRKERKRKEKKGKERKRKEKKGKENNTEWKHMNGRYERDVCARGVVTPQGTNGSVNMRAYPTPCKIMWTSTAEDQRDIKKKNSTRKGLVEINKKKKKIAPGKVLSK